MTYDDNMQDSCLQTNSYASDSTAIAEITPLKQKAQTKTRLLRKIEMIYSVVLIVLHLEELTLKPNPFIIPQHKLSMFSQFRSC
jgi:hypothetical protein